MSETESHSADQIDPAASTDPKADIGPYVKLKCNLEMGHNRVLSDSDFEERFLAFNSSWAFEGEDEQWKDYTFEDFNKFLAQCPDKYRQPCSSMMEMQTCIIRYLQDHPVTFEPTDPQPFTTMSSDSKPEVELTMGSTQVLLQSQFRNLFQRFWSSWKTESDRHIWPGYTAKHYIYFLSSCPSKYRRSCMSVMGMQALVVEYLEDHPVMLEDLGLGDGQNSDCT